MSQSVEPKGEFKFILNAVPPDTLQPVAQELTTLFPLDLPNAVNIARSAPIILADKLTPQQARSVGTYAVRLKALGADVQITSQPVGKLQTLRWPLLPDIAKRPGNHLICPNCGVRLQVQVYLPMVEAESPPTAGPEPAAKVEPPPAQLAPQAPQPPPEQPAPQAPQPPPAQPAPQAPQPPPLPPAEPDLADEVILEPITDDDLSDEVVILEEEPQDIAVAAAATAALPGEAVGGGGSCRVMLVGKIRGEKKRKAAELVAFYLGLTEENALSQLTKTVVTVARDLTEDQAEECRKQFSDIGVKVKIKR